jgi:carbonic anhydrase
MFVNNRNWVDLRRDQDPDYFERLAQGQSPRHLFIGCSDSRVNANEITGSSTGDLFVHRNVANLVVATDVNFMSVLQFAVEVLKVEHVIVCGHYGCGGVHAAVDGEFHGTLDMWLTSIRDVYRLHYEELEAIDDPLVRHRRLVELNVEEQVYHLSATSIIQQAWPDNVVEHVHGWVYDIREGLLRDLDVNPRHRSDLDVYSLALPSVTQ